MNPRFVENLVSAGNHENFLEHSLSTSERENSETFTLNFGDEDTGNTQQPPFGSLSHTEKRQRSQPVISNTLGITYRITPSPYKDPNFSVLVIKPDRRTIPDNSILLQEMLSEIDDLLKNEYDWDDIDYRKPTPEDISRAKFVLIDFVFTMSYEGYLLKKPYISNSEDGGAKIEWHSDKRSLYLRIDRRKSIAAKIQDEPDRTTVHTNPFLQQDYLSLWKWIINE